MGRPNGLSGSWNGLLVIMRVGLGFGQLINTHPIAVCKRSSRIPYTQCFPKVLRGLLGTQNSSNSTVCTATMLFDFAGTISVRSNSSAHSSMSSHVFGIVLAGIFIRIPTSVQNFHMAAFSSVVGCRHSYREMKIMGCVAKSRSVYNVSMGRIDGCCEWR